MEKPTSLRAWAKTLGGSPGPLRRTRFSNKRVAQAFRRPLRAQAGDAKKITSIKDWKKNDFLVSLKEQVDDGKELSAKQLSTLEDIRDQKPDTKMVARIKKIPDWEDSDFLTSVLEDAEEKELTPAQVRGVEKWEEQGKKGPPEDRDKDEEGNEEDDEDEDFDEREEEKKEGRRSKALGLMTKVASQFSSRLDSLEDRRGAFRQEQFRRLVDGPQTRPGGHDSFAVMTAYQEQPKSHNKAAQHGLLKDLVDAGFPAQRDQRQKATWTYTNEKGEDTTEGEKSLIIPGLPFDMAMDLGRKYNQESVIYKSPDGTVGMYKFDPQIAFVSADALGKPAYALSRDPEKDFKKEEARSETRGWAYKFDFDFKNPIPWSDAPITQADVDKHVGEHFPSEEEEPEPEGGWAEEEPRRPTWDDLL